MINLYHLMNQDNAQSLRVHLGPHQFDIFFLSKEFKVLHQGRQARKGDIISILKEGGGGQPTFSKTVKCCLNLLLHLVEGMKPLWSVSKEVKADTAASRGDGGATSES